MIDCLIGKSLQALEKTGSSTLCVAGGVAANGSLRKQLEEACREREIALHVSPPKLCTDNAVMGCTGDRAIEGWPGRVAGSGCLSGASSVVKRRGARRAELLA